MNQNLLDSRSVSLFRIAVGLLVIAGIWQRCVDFTFLYGSEGALPAEILPLAYGAGYPAIPSDQGFWALILGVGALSGLALVLGRGVPIASGLCLLVLGLIHARNPLLDYGADRVLRFEVLFVFLLSLRPSSMGGASRSAKILNLLVEGALVLQLCAIYVDSVQSRDFDAWWWRASALRAALHLDYLATPFGRWVAEIDFITEMSTRAALLFELFVPFLIVGLWRFWRARVLLLASLVLFHSMIAATLGLFYFACIMLAFWSACLPAEFWERAKQMSSRIPSESLENLTAIKAFGLLIGFTILGLSLLTPRLYPSQSSERVPILTAFGLFEGWAFFSPSPYRFDGWLTVEVATASGEVIDLVSGARIQNPTGDFFRSLPRDSLRRRQFRAQLGAMKNEFMLRAWARRRCREMGISGAKAGEVAFWSEVTDHFGKEEPVKREVLAQFGCR